MMDDDEDIPLPAETKSTVEEMIGEIYGCDRKALFSKARAANTMQFVKGLRGDGISMEDIERIYLAFARMFVNLNMALPEDGAFNLKEMALLDPIAREALEARRVEPDPDPFGVLFE